MKHDLVFLGAGAIGRGYLPWQFSTDLYNFVFVDNNEKIIKTLQDKGAYTGYRVRNKQLESRLIPVHKALSPTDFLQYPKENIDAIFVNVGPRSVPRVIPLLQGYKGPIILCENDPETAVIVKRSLPDSNAYFAIPDVITSNTAPRDLLAKDPMSLVSEDGVLFIDEAISGITGEFKTCSRKELIEKQWAAKLYLHNTPHCIAAYMRALCGVEYLHEAMAIPVVSEIVEGSMNEMLKALKLRWSVPHEFLDWYAQKELSRFRCNLLFDPISRVAREPLRKLEPDGRLMGAAQICISLGFVPRNILLGIGSALLFQSSHDNDRHINFLRNYLPSELLLNYILGLRKGEALELVLREYIQWIFDRLTEITTNRGNR